MFNGNSLLKGVRGLILILFVLVVINFELLSIYYLAFSNIISLVVVPALIILVLFYYFFDLWLIEKFVGKGLSLLIKGRWE